MYKQVTFAQGGGHIAGIAVGNEQAPVILCLHGWLDNAASFIPFFDRMLSVNSTLLEQYYFIAIDWPGHGHSTHRGKNSYYHFIDWSHDLLVLIENQGWQQIDIIGHSMGGMVATLFTSAFNEKVKQLLLIEAIGLITESESPSEQLRKGLLSRLQLAGKQKNIHKNIDSAIQARMNVSDLANEPARLLVERGLEQARNGVTWRSDPKLRNTSLQRYSLKQAVQIVANVHCPITLIRGDTGFDMVQQGIKVFAEHMANFQQFTIKGGHHPHMQSTQELLNIVEDLYNP